MAEFHISHGWIENREEGLICVTCERRVDEDDVALEWSTEDAFCFRLTREAAAALAARLASAAGRR